MKLRLTQAGFESYTGQMGVVNFDNGLSLGDVLAVDALRLAGIFGAEWEDGSAANVSQLYLDNMNTEAPVYASAGSNASRLQEEAAALEVAPVEPSAVIALGDTYTEDQLAAIADKDGIAGLRVIADPLDIKGNSIRGLIDAILKAVPTPKAA